MHSMREYDSSKSELGTSCRVMTHRYSLVYACSRRETSLTPIAYQPDVERLFPDEQSFPS